MIIIDSARSLDVSGLVGLPDIEELLFLPNLSYMSADDCFYENEVFRHLIQHAPIKNDRKYVLVESRLQYLSPNVISVPRGYWHVDTSSFSDSRGDRTHLLISECTARTEFTKGEIHLDLFDEEASINEVEVYLNRNQHLFESEAIESNRFITFGAKHLHRCIKASKNEFRFMFRVLETDYIKPNPTERARLYTSCVYIDDVDHSTIDLSYCRNHMDSRDSIVINGDEVVINIT
jgi:hypothetical protein